MLNPLITNTYLNYFDIYLLNHIFTNKTQIILLLSYYFKKHCQLNFKMAKISLVETGI